MKAKDRKNYQRPNFKTKKTIFKILRNDSSKDFLILDDKFLLAEEKR